MCCQAYLIDGFVERRLMQSRRVKKSLHKLPYVRITDELRQQTSWPPPSQLGGSLVDIMRLENSFFQAEQADEVLLPKSVSGSSVSDVANSWPQSDLAAMNDIKLKHESCFSSADSCGKSTDLDMLSAVNCGQPRPYDGTVL